MGERRTIEVDTLVEWVNTRLAAPDSVHRIDPDMSPDKAFRMGVLSLLEQVLMHTGRYRGFQYNESEFLDPSRLAELGASPDEMTTLNRSVLRDGYDETRRHYFSPTD